MPKSVTELALNDITTHIDEQHILEFGEARKTCEDNWYVTRGYLRTKETIRLNRQLGVHKVNYFGNTNGFISK